MGTGTERAGPLKNSFERKWVLHSLRFHFTDDTRALFSFGGFCALYTLPRKKDVCLTDDPRLNNAYVAIQEYKDDLSHVRSFPQQQEAMRITQTR
jgi:hypothetical protein